MKWLLAVVIVSTGFPVAAGEPPDLPAPPVDLPLAGSADVSFEAFYRHVRSRNARIDGSYLRELYDHYRDLSVLEGMSLLVALAQMTHETNYLLFTGSVRATQFNYAGIGATSETTPGDVFPDIRTGVAAHIQHLKAYANDEPLVTELVDPRFYLVVRGTAPTVQSLTGRWAVDPGYGRKVLEHARRLAGYE